MPVSPRFLDVQRVRFKCALLKGHCVWAAEDPGHGVCTSMATDCASCIPSLGVGASATALTTQRCWSTFCEALHLPRSSHSSELVYVCAPWDDVFRVPVVVGAFLLCL